MADEKKHKRNLISFKKAEALKNKALTKSSPCGVTSRPVRVKRIQDARRLLSRLIYLYQLDQVTGEKARVLTYLVNSFIALWKDIELAGKIEELEKALKEKDTQKQELIVNIVRDDDSILGFKDTAADTQNKKDPV